MSRSIAYAKVNNNSFVTHRPNNLWYNCFINIIASENFVLLELKKTEDKSRKILLRILGDFQKEKLHKDFYTALG